VCVSWTSFASGIQPQAQKNDRIGRCSRTVSFQSTEEFSIQMAIDDHDIDTCAPVFSPVDL